MSALTGGTETVKYFVSIGSRFQDGTYRKSGAYYSQVDFRSNIDAKLANNINLSIDVAGRQENRHGTIYSEYETFRNVPRGKPTDVAWWFNGKARTRCGIRPESCCYVTNMGGYNKDIRYILESNIRLNINIPWIKGFISYRQCVY